MNNLFNGQAVKVAVSHNHIQACAVTGYTVGAVNRVQGVYMVNLLKDSKSVGTVPEGKLRVA